MLYVDDDATVRTWYEDYQENGIEGLANFGHEVGTCRLTIEQQATLKAWIAVSQLAAHHPRRGRLDRAGMRHRLPDPLNADPSAASAGHGTPQAESHLPRAGYGETGRLIAR